MNEQQSLSQDLLGAWIRVGNMLTLASCLPGTEIVLLGLPYVCGRECSPNLKPIGACMSPQPGTGSNGGLALLTRAREGTGRCRLGITEVAGSGEEGVRQPRI